MELANHIRGYRFMAGVFRDRPGDPFCGTCSAFANTLKAVRERMTQFEAEQAANIAALPPDLAAMLAAARSELSSLPLPAGPAGQKKAGRCRLPQGVCFIKASYALLQQV